MKKKLVIVVILVLIGAMAFGISRVIQNPEQYEKVDSEIAIIVETCSVTEDQAGAIWDTLQDCGVGAIETIEREKVLDDENGSGYRITTQSGNHVSLYLNDSGEVTVIRHAGEVLYPQS